MIEVNIYNNGVEIKGHAVQHICSEVSIMTWNLANILSYYCNIPNEYYTSVNDNKENLHEGLTYLILDKNCKESMWQLGAYRHNMKVWGEEMWNGHVIINEIDDDLSSDKYKNK